MMAKKNKIPTGVIITAIAALTIIQIAAMFFGINGGLRTVIVGTICVATGLAIPLDKIIK